MRSRRMKRTRRGRRTRKSRRMRRGRRTRRGTRNTFIRKKDEVKAKWRRHLLLEISLGCPLAPW